MYRHCGSRAPFVLSTLVGLALTAPTDGKAASVRVEAKAIDRYSGGPAANINLKLQRVGAGPDYNGVSDASGRVMIESVIEGRYVFQWSAGTAHLSAPDRGFYVTVPPGDLGTFGLSIADWAENSLGPLCQKAAKASAALATNVVVFEKYFTPPWKHDWSRQPTIERAWKVQWKGVVCIDSESKDVGEYVAADGTKVGSATKTTLKIKVIRLDTGKEYKTKLSADPPKEIQTSHKLGATGDTSDALEKWIGALPE